MIDLMFPCPYITRNLIIRKTGPRLCGQLYRATLDKGTDVAQTQSSSMSWYASKTYVLCFTECGLLKE
jgi:hypothetical protein